MVEYIRVTVTEEDIENGEVADSKACPIACAINRAYPLYRARVNEFQILLVESDEEKNKLYKTSRRAARFISRFDANKAVKPATFRFSLTDEISFF